MDATDTDGMNDAEVIAASRFKPDSFGVIFDRYFEDVYRFLSFRTSHEVAGLVSDVFLKAFEKRTSFDASQHSAKPMAVRHCSQPRNASLP